MKIQDTQAANDMEQADKSTKALGQYPTRVWVAEALVERHFAGLDSGDCVIEPSCGPGAFLAAVPPHVHAIGIDIDAKMVEAARANTGREILQGDFRTLPLTVTPTAVIGNPPFNLRVIDGFLERSFALLPNGGRVGFILPAYAFQTAGRVAEYAERWSLMQEMIPRNIFPGLSLPLVFAIFSKDRRRTLVGFALYREAADVQQLPHIYRDALAGSAGPVWRQVVECALVRLGGVADLPEIYREIEGNQPTRTQFWREKVRQTLRRYSDLFQVVNTGRYALDSSRRVTVLPGAGSQFSLLMP
ncbi:TRM11 family SAM-dependent methyltransferase [Thiobacillus denitrificans]|uniref:TRM11 family SAM-dependent methyltransferase n=1 Tax=Thiobacillus denitrificans TaxID=36861 RepID=UPI000361AF37|nr:class I SAM-dependent methyltransferase [Thiobacillus denitrificans]